MMLETFIEQTHSVAHAVRGIARLTLTMHVSKHATVFARAHWDTALGPGM
jgi:hypothetical protein